MRFRTYGPAHEYARAGLSTPQRSTPTAPVSRTVRTYRHRNYTAGRRKAPRRAGDRRVAGEAGQDLRAKHAEALASVARVVPSAGAGTRRRKFEERQKNCRGNDYKPAHPRLSGYLSPAASSQANLPRAVLAFQKCLDAYRVPLSVCHRARAAGAEPGVIAGFDAGEVGRVGASIPALDRPRLQEVPKFTLEAAGKLPRVAGGNRFAESLCVAAVPTIEPVFCNVRD